MGRPLLSSTFTAVGTGASSRSFVGDTVSTHLILTGTGALTAAVTIQGSMNGVDWEALMTFSLSGNDRVTDMDTSQLGWAFLRASCTAISGTDARLLVAMGEG